MQYSHRFYISWLASALLMYVAFYVWHGLFLTDLSQIRFSKSLFLILVGLVYLVISFVLYRIYELKVFDKYFSNALLRGVTAGFILGFILFAIVAVLGISFTKHINSTYLIADCLWQIAEQIIGGVIIGLGKILIFEPHPELNQID